MTEPKPSWEDIGKANELIQMYRRVAQKFINKVEANRARSIETYAELKACEEAADKFYRGKP